MIHPRRLVIASGKGGTGKTTIATNLAVALAEAGLPTTYLDCDVEEPNGHLFLRPTLRTRQDVTIPVPEVDVSRCTLCGRCSRACRYSAILQLPDQVLTFPKLCHGCGGCTLACPTGAIREIPRPTGQVETGTAGLVGFVQGRLAIGEAMAPPVIRQVLAAAPPTTTHVIDAPPGTACPVIAAICQADAVLLVTEPTPFGLHDLKLAVALVRELGLPCGVAVNRVGAGDRAVFDYCRAEQLPVVLELPHDREVARAYSRGELLVTSRPAWKTRLLDAHQRLLELAATGAKARPSSSEEWGPCPPSPGDLRERRPPGPLPPRADHGPGRPELSTAPPVPSSPSVQPVDNSPLAPPAQLEPAHPLAEPSPPDRKPPVRELVVVSGKGGTGKTSIVASFLALAQPVTGVDCDVDAADLHLVLDPAVQQRHPFSGGHTATIDPLRCTDCGRCAVHCRFGAIRPPAPGVHPTHAVDPLACEGCGVCVDGCPAQAVRLVPSASGEWFVSSTRFGPLVHARLGIAQENSGRLVSLVRRQAQAVARAHGSKLVLVDGSPGIGCPVIASITGAYRVLLVTEPTLSGLHDLRRVAELCRQFGIPAGICINKADLNPEVAQQIEQAVRDLGLPLWGRIPYDEAVTAAQLRGRSVEELGDGPAAQAIRALWEQVVHDRA